jgi:hypothetical protein
MKGCLTRDPLSQSTFTLASCGSLTAREEDEEDFPPRMVDDLVQRLQGNTALPLSPGEKLQLASVARAVLEVCDVGSLGALRLSSG